MGSSIRLLLIAILALPAIHADDDANLPASTGDVLERYMQASSASQARLRGMSMEVDIDAQIPRLKKQGTLHALRTISNVGHATYDALRWAGDKTIKTDVIARYLKAEEEAQTSTQDLTIGPANYKFKYKGLNNRNGRSVHVLEVKPHKKRVGLFKGEIWVDPETFLPVREAGDFVKSPSIFIKKLQFVRDYDLKDGAAYPARIVSIVDTRIVGKAELTVSFSNFTATEPHSSIETADRDRGRDRTVAQQ